MSRNPLLNASAAIGYIVAVASIMFYGSRSTGPDNSVFAPIAALSLFTLSAAVMGYIFCFQPLQLFLEGKKKAAVDLFLKTVAVFAAVTAVILLLFFSGVLK